MRQNMKAPDWASLIADMIAIGITCDEIGRRTDTVVTDRMAYHYARGVQPVHWRGEALLNLWCTVTGKKRDDVPMTEVIRGHRAERRARAAMANVNLPKWPPSAPVAVKPLKRGPGRPKRVAVEV